MRIKILLRKILIEISYSFIGFLPVKKGSYLFESHDDFTEGTFLFFEYLKNNKNNNRLAWIIESKHIGLAKTLGVKRYILFDDQSLKNEIKSHYYLNTTERFLFSHRNIGYPKLKNNQVRLYFPHGQPIKKVYRYMSSLYDSIYIVPSDFSKKLHSSLYHIDMEKMYLAVNPRISPLLGNLTYNQKSKYLRFLNIYDETKIIVCLMTWDASEKKASNVFPFSLSRDELKTMNDKLSANNQVMVVKLHPMYKEIETVQYLDSFSNIKLVLNEDFINQCLNIYELLSISSMLITDCSSVFIDYYLTEKPIIFYDIKSLSNERRIELIDNYRDYMAGPIINTTNELFYWINNIEELHSRYLASIKHQKDLWFSNLHSNMYSLIEEALIDRLKKTSR